jgi:3',5'-cyclic AMP phosphodiesterase CpdA
MRRTIAVAAPLLLAILLRAQTTEQPFYFVMLSDTQFGMYTGNRSFAQETANFEFAVAAVNRMRPGFVIVLGDLVNRPGDREQVAEYLRISRRIDPSIPVYHVPGNHDVGNEPTPESLAAYRTAFGGDYYSFSAGPVHAIVLNSTLIHSPQKAMRDYEEQDRWLRKELEGATRSAASHTVVFQHHPYFLAEPFEPDRYENIPLARRRPLLELFRTHGVRHVFAGHTHKNVLSRDGRIEIIATAPVGKPLGTDGSGIRIAKVTGEKLEHRYFDFGKLPPALWD